MRVPSNNGTQLKSKASGDPNCGKAEEALESLCTGEGA